MVIDNLILKHDTPKRLETVISILMGVLVMLIYGGTAVFTLPLRKNLLLPICLSVCLSGKANSVFLCFSPRLFPFKRRNCQKHSQSFAGIKKKKDRRWLGLIIRRCTHLNSEVQGGSLFFFFLPFAIHSLNSANKRWTMRHICICTVNQDPALKK